MSLFFSTALIFITACDSKSESEDSASSQSEDSQPDEDLNEPEDSAEEEPDPNAPQILSADAWCYPGGDSTGGFWWSFTATATDPQGADTLQSLISDAIVVRTSAGGDLAKLDMVCSPTGECLTSMSEEQLGAACEQASTFTAIFTLIDEDGYASDPLEISCRQGTDPAG